MTIKQLGGVFGRNPTFNDVTIEGQLTFDGDIDINSDLTGDGTLKADALRLGSIAPSYNVQRNGQNHSSRRNNYTTLSHCNGRP